MALQPASGVRDLNPQQVQRNQELRETLAEVFRLWGYEEVTPPRIERMDTLKAGGAIDSRDIVRLVSDEPLGLRPELTASIARAACTRLLERQRPLRLWSCGTVFESRSADEGGQCIEENLHCGVELFGGLGVESELELFSLLLASLKGLNLNRSSQPRLLIGHTSLMDLLLEPFEQKQKHRIRTCLSQYDRLGLQALGLAPEAEQNLGRWLDRRGTPQEILAALSAQYPNQEVLNQLQRLFSHLNPLAEKSELKLQLDPTFQPHYELYDGIVLQLVCQGASAPVVIARGGRYDSLVRKLGGEGAEATGLGFSYCVDDIRDLPGDQITTTQEETAALICFGPTQTLESALERQMELHQQGRISVLDQRACGDKLEALDRLKQSCCDRLEWIDT